MKYEKIFGTYSHESGRGIIYDNTEKGRRGWRFPRVIYDKEVTYQTYKFNLKWHLKHANANEARD